MVSNRDQASDPFILAERLLSNLPGVISAKINTDQEGEVIEVHILADHNRAPKQIVRDVESALVSGFNISVDHKRISVAQLRRPDVRLNGKEEFEVHFPANTTGDHKEDKKAGNQGRLRFDRFEVASSGNLKCRAEVILANGGGIFRGVCEDTNTAVNQMKISAKAVLSALEEYLRGEKAFTLEELKVIERANSPVVMVVVGAVTSNGATSLIGTSFLGKDRNRSAALATLKAVNRYLGSE
jgi:hypothetical protein